MGINPSASNGLLACSDEQFGKGTENPVSCPAASKIGTVSIETPVLPEPIDGDVFVGSQLSRDPTSGDEYRIFVDGESTKFGLSVRLVGHVSADPTTGQLTTRFSELPAGAVQRLHPETERRPHLDPDQPLDLRPAHDRPRR